jgi:hypothetical protein
LGVRCVVFWVHIVFPFFCGVVCNRFRHCWIPSVVIFKKKLSFVTSFFQTVWDSYMCITERKDSTTATKARPIATLTVYIGKHIIICNTKYIKIYFMVLLLIIIFDYRY